MNEMVRLYESKLDKVEQKIRTLKNSPDSLSKTVNLEMLEDNAEYYKAQLKHMRGGSE